MSGEELTADHIRALLHELGRRLQARGVNGNIKLVGGASILGMGTKIARVQKTFRNDRGEGAMRLFVN